jgi:cation diffusion facilitator CzcD-associated flavoprotein CzcO
MPRIEGVDDSGPLFHTYYCRRMVDLKGKKVVGTGATGMW